MMSETDVQDEDEEVLLPQYLSPADRHLKKREAGEHPKISVGDTLGDIKRGIPYGVFIADGERLISLMRGDRRCPVCGEPNALKVDSGMALINELEDRRYEDGGSTTRNDVVDEMDGRGYKPITHRARSNWFVGIASPQAVAEYEEWKEDRGRLTSLKERARRVAANGYVEDNVGRGEITKGVMLAAIYELLDAKEYDARPLLDRNAITKEQLLTVIARLQSVKIQNDPSLHGDEWVKVNEYGVGWGRVEWEIPEWVGNEGLIFDESEIPTVWDDVEPDIPD